MNYSDFLARIAALAVDDPTNADFLAMLPAAIEYSESRICRDLDLLATVTPNLGSAFTPSNRLLSFTQGTFVTVQQINVITPAGQTNPVTAVRNPMIPVSTDFLNFAYGSNQGASVPRYFAMLDDHSFVVGPWPDAAYTCEIVGTVRPTPLSASNATTFIATYLPDLMTMAAMIYVSGWQKDYGRASDDPQAAQSYENQYQTLLKGAAVEEARRKFQASGWTSLSPPVAATPTRG